VEEIMKEQAKKQEELNLKPLNLKDNLYATGQPVMAAEAWAGGPKKPRHQKRHKYSPPQDLSLENINKLYNWLNVLEPEIISTPEEIKKIENSEDIDAFIVNSVNSDAMGPLFYELSRTGIPIIPTWDSWGYSWNGRFIKGWAEKIGFETFIPVGDRDIDILVRALTAIKKIRNTKILYIGDIPSHSVNSDISLYDIYKDFNVVFQQISMPEYLDAVNAVNKNENLDLAREWNEKFNVMDSRNAHMGKYSAIYLALRELLQKYNANSLTMDCAYLPDVETVPCVAAACLIDEGIMFGCEGDVSQLLSLQLLTGLSGKSGLMGNLFENAIHKDIEENTIVINHDVLPPSMAKTGCKINFRDFHAVGKGSTLFAGLPEEPVTMGGLSFDRKQAWLSKGVIAWAEDTVHCRLSVGIKVDDSKRIMKNALGHHQVFTYGDYLEHAELALKLLGVKTHIL
jgi:hypothetical protein